MEVRHYVIVGNRKYRYVLKPERNVTVLICEDANIRASFANDEIPKVLINLPKLIVEAINSGAPQTEVLRFRVTKKEKQQILKNTIEAGFDNVSAFLRYVATQQSPPKKE